MHDIKYIRENGEAFDGAMARRGLEPQSQALLTLDQARRDVQTRLQELQAKRNEESKKIGALKKAGEDAQGAMDAVAAIKVEMGELEEEERLIAQRLSQHLAALPNIMADDVPDGADEDENVEVSKWGDPSTDKVPEHFEIGEALGMMDAETAAKMSGSRFTILSGGLARLERALAQFFLDTHTDKNGYTEVSPPLLVRDNALFGTGQLPKFYDDQFLSGSIGGRASLLEKALEPLDRMAEQHPDKKPSEVLQMVLKDAETQEEYWLIPTSEVPLTNIVADSIVDENDLPRRYTAHTPCFRSEAGSAGRDTRGMIRQHQFYKVEMIGIVKPEDSEAEQERMVECAQGVLEALKLPYRTVKLCSGDTGFGARRTYDLEVWLPGQQRYREISSVSTCGDFQARRMNARFKRAGEKHTTFLHTLNGSGVAVGRALIAVLENYYDPADGGVHVPDVLKPYMGGVEKITA
ncbi:MAG: serine--tRNA ligase [Alphaproteobacteria bacterium]|nr:serine--tRNA ligase [Alphaproteobacteria bacterium]